MELALYNLAGQKVLTLAMGFREAGRHTARWDGRDDQGRALASGVCPHRLQAGAEVETRKLLLLHWPRAPGQESLTPLDQPRTLWSRRPAGAAMYSHATGRCHGQPQGAVDHRKSAALRSGECASEGAAVAYLQHG